MRPDCSALRDAQQRFLTMWPVMRDVARARFADHPDRQDKVAEVRGICWEQYLRCLANNNNRYTPYTLAYFACRRAACGRTLCSGKRTANTAGINPGYKSPTLHKVHFADAIDYRHNAPFDVAAYRIDFPAWVRTLSRSLRRTLLALWKRKPGELQGDIARALGISPSRLSQRKAELLASYYAFNWAA